jgi:hypothetical protein
MTRKWNAPETIGETLARIMDVKRQLIEAGMASGDLGLAREMVVGVRDFSGTCERIWSLGITINRLLAARSGAIVPLIAATPTCINAWHLSPCGRSIAEYSTPRTGSW